MYLCSLILSVANSEGKAEAKIALLVGDSSLGCERISTLLISGKQLTNRAVVIQDTCDLRRHSFGKWEQDIFDDSIFMQDL